MERRGSSELGVPSSGQDPAGAGGRCEPLPRGAGGLFGCAHTGAIPVLAPGAVAAVGGGRHPYGGSQGGEQPPEMVFWQIMLNPFPLEGPGTWNV